MVRLSDDFNDHYESLGAFWGLKLDNAPEIRPIVVDVTISRSRFQESYEAHYRAPAYKAGDAWCRVSLLKQQVKVLAIQVVVSWGSCIGWSGTKRRLGHGK